MAFQRLVELHASHQGDSPALLAPGREAMNYSLLLTQMERVGSQLNQLGVGRGDRVAIVMPRGPEMVGAFLTITVSASLAPLNPDFRAPEYENYLNDLKPKALVVPEGSENPAVAVAESRGIPVIDLVVDEKTEAGRFELCPRGKWTTGRPIINGFSRLNDEALVLHTSGTTSRQKVISLKHRNISTSAHSFGLRYHLTCNDRCLNFAPLFHTQGLVTATLSTIITGGSVVCTPGFIHSEFFNWLSMFEPTWYPTVPTLHQEILAMVESNPKGFKHHRLRFLYSGSAPLPAKVANKMEQILGIPVLEGYGMTEATNHICLNPLPPLKRKRGSAGLPAVPEVVVLNEDGGPLMPGQVGEVAIGGDLVAASFDDEIKTNPDFFTNGWFRTGDLGYFDTDGYLFLIGCLKEMINRGGEKVSPREVDEVLMDYPAVAQALTFAVPHHRLGEDVAAAIVLRERMNATADDLITFSTKRLADFKVPRRIVFLEELPKGPTGKLKRIGLAEKLGLNGDVPEVTARFVEPRSELERNLANIWCEVMSSARIGIDDNFFELGGDSILASQIITRVKFRMGVEVPFHSLFERPTITEMAKFILIHTTTHNNSRELERILDELEGPSCHE